MAIKINGDIVIENYGKFDAIVLSDGALPADAEAGTIVVSSGVLYVCDGRKWINLSEREAASGGTIIKNGVARTHEYFASGTFTVNYEFTFSYEILGGGGGGGSFIGGGGGAGGYRSGEIELSPGEYIVTVGSGGGQNGDGGDSGFTDSLTATVVSAGGGAGGLGSNGQGKNGGCGGGGAGSNATMSGQNILGGSGNTPATSPSQGFPGGYGHGYQPIYAGGGGGGGIGGAGSNRGGSWNSPAGPGGPGAEVYGVIRGGGGG